MEDGCARGGASHNSAPRSAQRERGVIGGRRSAAAEAAATGGAGVSRFWYKLGGLVPAASAAGNLATSSYPALALRRARGWIVSAPSRASGPVLASNRVGLRAKPALCLRGELFFALPDVELTEYKHQKTIDMLESSSRALPAGAGRQRTDMRRFVRRKRRFLDGIGSRTSRMDSL